MSTGSLRGEMGITISFRRMAASRMDNTEFLAGIDTLLIGHKTFETVLAFPQWPYMLGNAWWF